MSNTREYHFTTVPRNEAPQTMDDVLDPDQIFNLEPVAALGSVVNVPGPKE